MYDSQYSLANLIPDDGRRFIVYALLLMFSLIYLWIVFLPTWVARWRKVELAGTVFIVNLIFVLSNAFYGLWLITISVWLSFFALPIVVMVSAAIGLFFLGCWLVTVMWASSMKTADQAQFGYATTGRSPLSMSPPHYRTEPKFSE